MVKNRKTKTIVTNSVQYMFKAYFEHLKKSSNNIGTGSRDALELVRF